MASISISSSNFPSMADIMEASRAQNLDLQLQTVGPFFRVTARKLDGGLELGRAEGVVRAWWVDHLHHQQHKDKGAMKKILHLDSMRLKRETLGIERSIFGIGLFIGAVAVRHGYDQGCSVAQLLAINDSDLYHSKVRHELTVAVRLSDFEDRVQAGARGGRLFHGGPRPHARVGWTRYTYGRRHSTSALQMVYPFQPQNFSITTLLV